MNTVKINSGNTQMIAHRGVSGLEKENTLCAFVAAGNRSYFGVETDVHRTADGKFVIIHDDNTKRVAGDGQYCEVEKVGMDVLRHVKLHDIDDTAGRVDLRLPTLLEYINCCKKYEKICVLELKNRIPTEDIGKIIDDIRSVQYLDHVIFISFNKENMVDMRQMLPNQPLQFLTSAELDDDILNFLLENHLDLDVYYKRLTEDWVKKLHANGIKINVWTVDKAEDGERLASWGVDYITSNILE